MHQGGGSKDGSTATPINDVVVWQKCAGIYNTYKYEVIGDILADTACMEKLFESDSANKYLMRSPEIFNTIINNADALTFMGNIHEVRNAIATTEWMSTAVGALGYDSYIKVFKHRSQISSEGNVDSYNNNYSVINFKNGDGAKCSYATNRNALGMYDDTMANNTSSSSVSGTQPHYWYYTFSTDFICKAIQFRPWATGNYTVYERTLQIEAYDDNSNSWIVLGTDTLPYYTDGAIAPSTKEMKCNDNVKAYKQYRLYVSGYEICYRVSGSSPQIGCAGLRWLGVKPNVA